jgi:hypothetical protein
MSELKTIKIKASHESQGDYVLINESDFDPNVHELFDADGAAQASAPKMSVAELKQALADKGVEIPEGAKKADLLALLEAAA